LPHVYVPLKYGETALHIAYKKGSYKAMQLLISADADETIKNKVSIHMPVILL